MEMINPPCSVNEIINHLFNYENLQRYLEYLLHLDKRAIDQIYELRLKFEELADVKQDITEIKFKLDLQEKKFEDINTQLNNHQLKLIEVENQATGFSNKIQTLETDSTEYKKKINFFDENVKNLNKVTEENCKSIERMNNTLNTTKSLVEDHAGVIDSHEKTLITINKELSRLMNLEDTFVTFREKALKKFTKLKKKNTEFSNFNMNIQNKIEEIDTNLSKLSISLTDIFKLLKKDEDVPLLVQNKLEVPQDDKKNSNQNFEPKTESVTAHKKSVDTHKSNLTDTNVDHSSDAIYVEFKDYKLKVDKLYKKFEEMIGKQRNERDDDDRLNESIRNDLIDNNENKENNELSLKQINYLVNNIHDGKGKDSNSSAGNFLKMINVLTENQKTTSFQVNIKANKDDLENSNKNINLEIEKLQSTLMRLDEKIKKLTEEGLNKSINKDEIISILNKYGKEIITLEITNLISKEIEENSIVKNMNYRCETSNEEINKLYESLVDIRRQSLEEKRSDPQFDDKLKGINQKMDDLEYMLKYLKNQFDENFRGLEEEQNMNENPNLNLKDLIRSLKGDMRGVTERIDKVVVKQDNLTGDVLSKIKKDLSSESNRILEEFRNDLKNSIGKIDEQLQNKVDHILLDDFGKRIDNKLSNEINKKIDKHDLKKNNTYISKKIDNLENKISRTLVDTLIDLQIEEAPLIVKKGVMGDKCASCNQILQFNPNNSNTSAYTINVSNSQQPGNNNSDDNGRYKLRTIQDNSYKYGTGSYSRVLSNANPNTLNDDLKLKTNNSKKYINTSVQLPDINNTALTSRKIISETPIKKKDYSLNREEKKDYSVSSLLSEELEKKVLKPDNLIKASNKYFDNIDKKK